MAITYKHTSSGGVIYRLDIQKARLDKQVTVINSI